MKTNVVMMKRVMIPGDRFIALKGKTVATFQVMARELGMKGQKHVYWVSQVVQGED